MAHDGEDLAQELPAVLALAWGLNPAPRRGPKATISVGMIVQAGMKIADQSGLAAVSMKSVADELGFTAMSLYRHIDSKDDLLRLMLDAGFGEVPESVRKASAQGWRAGCEEWVRQIYAVCLKRPWILDIPILDVPMTPLQTAWLEAALESMKDLPLGRSSRLFTALTMSSLAMANARLVRDMRLARGSAGSTGSTGSAEHANGQQGVQREYSRTMTKVLDSAKYPEVLAMLSSGELDDDAEEDEHESLEFALVLVLDGVAQRLAGSN